ncbi:MAG: hypothetical protein ACOC43_01790 [Desulfohalobiaceae bacterium]
MCLIYFPWMHPQLLSDVTQIEVCLLDPGLGHKESGKKNLSFWQPGILPLQGQKAQAYLQQVHALAQQYRDPEELALQAREGDKPPLFAQTSAALAKELRQRLNPQSESRDDASRNNALQAQMVLLLAWDLEEQTLEQDRLEKGLEDKWSRLQDELGIDEEQPDYFPGRGFFHQEAVAEIEPTLWAALLNWFLFFLQPGDWLYVDQEWIYSEWQELGLLLEPLLPEERKDLGLQQGSDNWKKLCARGRDLVLESPGKKDKPWLEEEYKVLLPPV